MVKKWWEILAVFLLMLALAIISTYPLVLYFDTGIPYSPFGGAKVWNRSGDQMQLLYWFWLVKENFTGAIPFNTNPYEFNMVLDHETTGLNTVPLAFLYMLFSPLGDVAAYNCVIISSYVFAGVFMYLLVRLYTNSKTGALLAAIIFTFAPSRINGFAAGHGYGFLYFCYPFILYFLEKGVQSTKIRYGFLSGIGLIFLSMLEPHLIFYIMVFLGIYVPVRVVALFPVQGDSVLPRAVPGRGALSWSIPRSLFILWAAGAAVVVYVQFLFFCRDQDPFFTPVFWWVLGIYPFIPVIFSLCLAAVYQRLSFLSFSESLSVESGSLTPLFLLIPLSLVSYFYRPVETGVLVGIIFVVIIGMKLVLLRQYLFSMLKSLVDGMWSKRRSIYPLIPVICCMGLIVYRIVSTKAKKIDSTIAAGGRTLDDVALFSARLSDILYSMSNVYIGIVTAVLTGCFFLMLFWHLLLKKEQKKFHNENDLISLFYVAVALCCSILALGLAFGKSSLYALFYYYFPFFNYPRVSDRFITLVLFSLAILVGFMVKKIQQGCQRRASLRVFTLLILVAAGLQLKDFNVFKPMGINILDRGQDIYRYVKENVGDGLLLEIPLWPGDSHQSSLYQHYIMLDRVPRVNGSSPLVLTEYIDTVFKPLAGLNRGRLDRKQFELLHDLGVKFITVHNNRDVFLEKVSPFVPLTTVRRFQNSPYLEFIPFAYNTIYFKTWTGNWDRLFLFKVKSKELVGDETEQAWYTMPTIYGVNALHHQTGKVVKDKDIGQMVFQAVSGEDKPGFLVYGPYVTYPPGKFRANYSIYTDAEINEKAARIEVSSVSESGNITIHAESILTGSEEGGQYRNVALDFDLNQEATVEFRVFYYGKGQVRVKQIVVYREGKDIPLYLMEAEKMVGDIGLLAIQEEASGGKVIEVPAGKNKKGDLVYGPNRIFYKGEYTARVFLRTKNAGNCKGKGVAAVITITEGQNVVNYGQKKVDVCQLNGNSFEAVEVDFELSHDEDLSFHVRSTGNVGLQLDKIEVIRR
ncbi:hypothetical protein JYT85_01950 [Desulfocapsa sp. AH-315-G09]|nr:hypothetical protein [Desulfocapsa sp. AH-315-G09]